MNEEARYFEADSVDFPLFFTIILLMSERIALRDLGREYGEANFERFVALARQSSIPTRFAEVTEAVVQIVKKSSPDLNEIYLQVATRLFGRRFTNPTLAGYAVVYGCAMAFTKIWLEENDKLVEIDQWESRTQEHLQEIQSKATEADYAGVIEKMEPPLNMVREYRPKIISLVEKIRREAVIQCGQVVFLEQQQQNKSVRQKIGERLLGEHATKKDFGRVRAGVEEYFRRRVS